MGTNQPQTIDPVRISHNAGSGQRRTHDLDYFGQNDLVCACERGSSQDSGLTEYLAFSDTTLSTLASGLGILSVALIITYQFLDVDARKPQPKTE